MDGFARGAREVIEGLAVDDLHSRLAITQSLFAEASRLVRIDAKHEAG